MTRPPRLLTALVALALPVALLGACSDDDAVGGGDGPGPEVVLTTLADEVIVPSYEALVANLEALGDRLRELCTTPSNDTLAFARAQWSDTESAWASTRPGAVGPAITRRLMGSVGFAARADAVQALIAGADAIDPDALAAQGSAVRGIFAVEQALFADPSIELAGAAGARRCTFAASATELSLAASRDVLADWTGGYRDAFVAGMDGDRQASVSALVNEVTFALQQLDDAGLRALAEAPSYDHVPLTRREGPASFGLGHLRALLGGVVALIQGPDDDGLIALVRDRSEDTADRLQAALDRALARLRELPVSMADAYDSPPAIDAASEAMAELKVLVGTEVASELGVTIGFSDADGDA